MEPKLILYPARLSEGQVETISERIDSAFIQEAEVKFQGDVSVEGEAYLAGNVLILHLKLKALALLPCRICNGDVAFAIDIPDFYLAEEGVTSGIFDCLPLIKESLLLELPAFIECEGGHCPHRQEMVKYLDHHSKDGSHLDGSHPFKDL